MCGIAGIVSSGPPVQPRRLKAMLDSIIHRGPDAEGMWISPDGAVGLGSRRLAILDLSPAGNQPMVSTDGRFVIAYNGEIYNYKEIRESHVRSGMQYRGNSDTEVLLNHFAKHGNKALEDFDGMFAFAIWDNATRELICARDRLGEKPFYYANEKTGFVFGSEIKALLAAGIARDVNERMLYGYFRNPSNAAVRGSFDETYYDGILKLPSATYLTVSNGVPRHRQRYWRLDALAEPNAVSFDDAKEQFVEIFTESVARRLRSDVQVGSSLSGGIDSSGIVCTVPRVAASGMKYNTFSARFENFEADEGAYIDEVNRATGAVAHSVFPTEQDLAADIASMFYYQDEPLESSSAFAQWSVMALAKNAGVTVLLDGQGGDELAAGYHSYLAPFLRDLRRVDPASSTREENAIRDRLNISVGGPSPGSAMASRKGAVKALAMRQQTRRALSRTPIVHAMPAGDTFLSRSFMWANGEEHGGLESPDEITLSDVLKGDLVDGKLEHYLRYADRNSMAHSREVRLPFLSHRLIEFMFSLPSEFKIQNGWTKYLVRSAFEGLVPDRILWRKDKVGFATPELKWMHSAAIQPMVADARSYLVRKGIVNRNWKDTGRENWQILMGYFLVSGDVAARVTTVPDSSLRKT